VPVTPDSPQATQWLIDELSKPIYQAARPTLFDQIAKAIADWLGSLPVGNAGGPPGPGIAVILILVVAGIVVAFLVFGLPRANRRSALGGGLFGDDDSRSAARIREDARVAARAGNYSTAIIEMFRAIARDLGERELVHVFPGTTARDFAVRAGREIEFLTDGFTANATLFDAVRYLDEPGTAEQWSTIEQFAQTVRAARPTARVSAS